MTSQLTGSAADTGIPLYIIHQDDTSFTVLVDTQFYDVNRWISRNPSEWTHPDIRSISPKHFCGIRIYGLVHQDGTPQYTRILAVQFPNTKYDVTAAKNLIDNCLGTWTEELGNWTNSHRSAHDGLHDAKKEADHTAHANPPSNEPLNERSDIRNPRPTLFQLLLEFANFPKITVEQKTAIRRIITDYLNHEIGQGKVFSYLSQTIAYHTFESIMSSLTSQQNKYNVAKNNLLYLQEVKSEESSAYSHEDEPEDKHSEQHMVFFYKTFVKYMKWLQVRWTHCAQDFKKATYGERVILFDSKGFFVGGQPLTKKSCSLQPIELKKGETNKVAIYSYDVLGMADLVSFSTIEQVNAYVLSPVEVYAHQGPSNLKDHTVHLGVFASGPVFIVYGGRFVSEDDNLVLLNSHISGFNLITKYWVVLGDGSNYAPAARHSHTSAIIPSLRDDNGANNYSEYLVVFGGVGFPWNLRGTTYGEEKEERGCIRGPLSDLVVMNDLWVFNFLTATWTCVELDPKPEKRFGMSFFVVDSSSLVVFGGETRLEYPDLCQDVAIEDYMVRKRFALPQGFSVLLLDTWCLHFNLCETDSLERMFQWKRVQDDGATAPRAHYAGLSLTASYPFRSVSSEEDPSTCTEPWWSLDVEQVVQTCNEREWDTQRVLFVLSGTTMNADHVLYETSQILLGLICPTPDADLHFSIVWRAVDCGHINYDGPLFLPRRGHSATFIDITSDSSTEEPSVSPPNTSTSTRLASANVGLDRLSPNDLLIMRRTYSKEELSGSHPLPSASSLPDVKGSHQQKPPTARVELDNPKTKKRGKSCYILITRGITSRGVVRHDYWLLQLSRLFPEILASRVLCPFKRALSSALQILKNTLCLPKPSSVVSFLESSPYYDTNFCMHPHSVSNSSSLDDLSVVKSMWEHAALNFQQAIFQQGSAIANNIPWVLATMVHHPFSCIGLFLENALAPKVQATQIHISFKTWRDQKALIIYDNGNGLSYSKLYSILNQFGTNPRQHTQESRPSQHLGVKFAISRLAHQCLIFSKSTTCYGVGFFSSPLNIMFETTHFMCPISCWSAKTHLPLSYPMEQSEFAQTLNLILTYSPLKTKTALRQEFDSLPHPTGTKIILFSLRKDLPYFYKTPRRQISSTSYSSSRVLIPPNRLSSYPQYSSDTCERRDLNAEGPITLSSNFPLYQCWEDSLDYSLATYIYWFHLYRDQAIFLNGTELCCTPSLDFSTQSLTNPKNNLWTFLHTRLMFKVHLKYLSVKQSHDHFSALFGFLNRHLSLFSDIGVSTVNVETEEYKGVNDTFCETGVLLYHDQRLVKRFVSRIPVIPELIQTLSCSNFPMSASNALSQNMLTAVICVPSSVPLKPTKEDFDASAHDLIEELCDTFESLLVGYLKNLGNQEYIRNLEATFGAKT